MVSSGVLALCEQTIRSTASTQAAARENVETQLATAHHFLSSHSCNPFYNLTGTTLPTPSNKTLMTWPVAVEVKGQCIERSGSSGPIGRVTKFKSWIYGNWSFIRNGHLTTGTGDSGTIRIRPYTSVSLVRNLEDKLSANMRLCRSK